jgi:Ser/Thr protein kinase RdoA (MazF antagonist)
MRTPDVNSIQSPTDYPNLIEVINNRYAAAIDEIYLHRDMIGYVYFAKSSSKKFVLKLYRSFDADNAVRSTGILQYLKNQAYPAVSIVPTRENDLYCTISLISSLCIAILFDYVEGSEPNLETEMMNIGQQVGRLHRVMDKYPGLLITRGQDFYIDRYISILHELDYDSSRIEELNAYGQALWSRMARLPTGFCHGDLHTGNMIQTGSSQYVVFDFDIASRTHSLIDVATLCDGSNFNHFEPGAYERTMHLFERFYQGYSRERAMNSLEIAAIFDFIPIRHYELIATITKCQGLQDLSKALLDEQYEWLMNWQNLCDRKTAL